MSSILHKLRSKKGAAIVVVAALLSLALVLIVIGSGGNKSVPQGSSKQTSSSPIVPYSAWVNAYLPKEKLTLKYPSSWSESGPQTTTVTGADQLTLTSPSNLLVTISTGVSGQNSGFNNILASQTITTLGSSFYLDFYNNHAQTGGLAEGACVVTQPNTAAAYPPSVNVSGVNQICIAYPLDEAGSTFESSVSSFKADPSFNQALQIIESITYQ